MDNRFLFFKHNTFWYCCNFSRSFESLQTMTLITTCFLYIEVWTLGSVCISTRNPALTRHRQHTTGLTAVHPLTAGFLRANQAMSHSVSLWSQTLAISKIKLVITRWRSCAKELKVCKLSTNDKVQKYRLRFLTFWILGPPTGWSLSFWQRR